MSLKSLAGQTAIYGISTVGAKLLSLFIGFYLTHVLTDVEYGAYTYIYSVIPVALVLLTMGLETGYFKFAGREGERMGKQRVFATTWGAVMLASAAFLAAVLLFNDRIAGAMGYGSTPSFVWIAGVIIVLDAVVALPFSRLREERRAGLFVKLKLTSVAITVLLSLFFYSVLPNLALTSEFWARLWSEEYGAGYAFIANLFASAATLLLIMPAVADVRPRVERRLLGAILLFSLPLLLSGIMNTANQLIDRQFIKLMLGDAQLGVYGAAVKLSIIMVVFIQMYRYAAEPYFLSGFKREDFVRMNAESLKYFFIVSVAVFLGVMLFVDLFGLLIGPHLRGGLAIVPVVMVANIFAGLTFNLSFWYKQTGRTKFAVAVTFTGLIFTVGLNFALIPVLGLMGAALARLVCEGVMMVMSYLLNRRHFPVPYDLRRIAEYAIVGAALYGLGFLTALLPQAAKYFCNLALFSIFILYAVRREKIDLWGFVRSLFRNR